LKPPVSNPFPSPKVDARSTEEGLFQELTAVLRGSLDSNQEPGNLEAASDPAFLAYARRHRVTALVGRWIQKDSAGTTHVQYQAEMNRNNLHGMLHVSELGRITSHFETNGVRSLCLKGPVLSILAYGGMGPRRVGDLDILISEADVIKADGLLKSLGFRLIIPKVLPTGVRLARYLERSPHFTYRGGANEGILVELHWRIFSNPFYFPITFELAYASRVTVTVSRFKLATLSEEYFGLHLLCHGAHHGWERLFWLHDLALLYTKGMIHPGRLLETGRRLGLEQVVGQCFLLLESIYRIPLPEALKEVCARADTKALADHGLRTCQIFGEHGAPGRAERLLYLLRLRKGFGYRWRVIEQEILQADKKDFLTVPYGMLPLLAVLRPFFLLKKKTKKQ
jgi:hypothetical protein